MKSWIARRLIDICCKKALKHDLRMKMLLEQEGIRFIYAIGSNVYERNKWFDRIERLEKWIGQ